MHPISWDSKVEVVQEAQISVSRREVQHMECRARHQCRPHDGPQPCHTRQFPQSQAEPFRMAATRSCCLWRDLDLEMEYMSQISIYQAGLTSKNILSLLFASYCLKESTTQRPRLRPHTKHTIDENFGYPRSHALDLYTINMIILIFLITLKLTCAHVTSVKESFLLVCT